MTAAPTVSVVVVNYNGEHYLPGMMDALEATGYPFLEIIVTDDASLDGSRLLLRHRYPHVKVLGASKNRGPGAARNAGIRAARGELVLVVDNDGHPFQDAIEPLVLALVAHPQTAAAMPRIILRGDPPRVHCDGAATHFTGHMLLLNGHRPVDEVEDDEAPIFGLMTTAVLLRREPVMAMGGFDEDYYFYLEDHDFGVRLALREGPHQRVPASRFDHLGGTAGLSFRAGRSYPKRRAHLLARNRQMFVLKTFSARALLVLSPALLVHELAQVAFGLTRCWLDAWFQACCWNVTHLASTLRKREVIQRARRVSDRSLLVGGPLGLHPGIAPKRGFLAWARERVEGVLGSLFGLLGPLLGPPPRA